MRTGLIAILFLFTANIAFGQLTLESQQVEKSVAMNLPNKVATIAALPLPARVMVEKPEANLLMVQHDSYAYTPKHYGFFCRVESKIEKKSRIAPRFRLGSTSYVDALEGKSQFGPKDHQ